MAKEAKKLTDKGVEKFAAPAAGQEEHWDAVYPGFGLRITSKNRKSWVLMKRLRFGDKPLVRFTLGEYPSMSLADAHKEADDYIEIINKFGDPREVIARKKDEADEQHRNTVKVVAGEFIEKYAKRKNRSWKQAENVFRLHVEPKWGKRPIANITRRDVHDLLDALIKADKPIAANRVLAHVRKLFNWCIERGILEMSPAVQIKPPAGKESARERDLSDDELKFIWDAAGEIDDPFGAGFRVLMIIAQRRGEVFGMQRPEIDFEKLEWTLPSAMTKSARSHVVPIPQMAAGIIEALPRVSYIPGPGKPAVESDYVFTTSGRAPSSGFSKAKGNLDEKIAAARKKAGLKPMPQWRLHDLRRTCATGMAKLGIPVDHIGRVLNHSPKGVTATVYDKHTYLPEKRHALDTWAKHLKEIVDPDPKAKTNVVDLPQRGAA